jgi:hypothetical protein
MTMRSPRGLIVLAGLAVIVGLPFLGKWARRSPGERCALDGMAINPVYRVRVVDEQGQDHTFCCIHCATVWLGRQPAAPRAVYVTDEVSGQEVEAASAWFVRSLVVTVPHTGNDIHAFRTQADAARHASTAHGTVLEDSDRPFRTGAATERRGG